MRHAIKGTVIAFNDALTALGWDQDWATAFDAAVADPDHEATGGHPARVIRHDGVAVLIDDGGEEEPRQVDVRHGKVPIAVGDWLVQPEGTDAGDPLPRRSLLRRRNTRSGAEQLLAANIDHLFIVCGIDRPLRPARIGRCVALADDCGASPVVVLTKADLATGSNEDAIAEASEKIASWDPSLQILTTSILTGDGLDAFRTAIGTGTGALLGESGAGKSSLTNALMGDEEIEVGEVRSGDAKGRHTTTSRQLHRLPSGGALIDTPGIRTIGLWADVESVDASFDDVSKFAEDCRFDDCQHIAEPGCAVNKAHGRGEVSTIRLATWLELRAEAEAASIHTDKSTRKRKQRAFEELQRRDY